MQWSPAKQGKWVPHDIIPLHDHGAKNTRPSRPFLPVAESSRVGAESSSGGTDSETSLGLEGSQCKAHRTFQTFSPITEGSQNQPGLLVSRSDSWCAFRTYSEKTLPFCSAGSAFRIASPQISVWMGPADHRTPSGNCIGIPGDLRHLECTKIIQEGSHASSLPTHNTTFL